MDHPKKQSFMLKMGELSTLFGFSHILGQIYGLLFLSLSELSLDEIKDALSVSKATVSLNIRELSKWGFVRKIWKSGTRKDFYEAETDLIKIFNTRLVDALLRRVRIVEEAADGIDAQEKSAQSDDNKIIQARIKEVRKVARMGLKVLEAVKDPKKLGLAKKWLF